MIVVPSQMSKLFNQPICFANQTPAMSVVDNRASLSTLGGCAVARNLVVGDTITALHGMNASGGLVTNMGNPINSGDAVNLGTLRSLADNSSLVISNGALRLSAGAFGYPFQGGDGVPVTLRLGTSLAITTGGQLDLASTASLSQLTVGRLTGLVAPTLPTDVVTRAYFDSHVTGLRVLPSVRCANTLSSSDISLSMVGVSVDGVAVVAGDRVLLAKQTDGTQNGVWIAVDSLPPQRASDLPSGASANNTVVYCEQGTHNAGLTFVVTNESGHDAVGSDAISYTQFAGNGSTTAGAGLIQQGGTLSVNIDQSGAGGLQMTNGGVLQLAADQPTIRTLGSLSELTVAKSITASTPPTAPGHLANKLYVDSLSYLPLGAGLLRDSSGALTIASNLQVQDAIVSGYILHANTPTAGAHVVNRAYLESLQWLVVDGSLSIDSASQILKLNASQPSITSIGPLSSLQVTGVIACDGAPTAANHVTTKAYVDALGYLRLGAGLTFAQGSIVLNPIQSFTDLSISYNVTAAALPTLSTHLTNKAYVDATVAARNPSAATHSSAAQATSSATASAKLSFSTFVNQTAQYPLDITYQRDAQAGDTWTMNKAGIYAISASMQFATFGSYAIVTNLGVYLSKGSIAGAGPVSTTFVGYLPAGTSVSLTGPSIDSSSTSSVWISRL